MLKDKRESACAEITLRGGPTDLGYITEDRKVVQSFGHQPLILAMLLFATASVLCFHSDMRLLSVEFLVVACCFVLAFLLIVYDKRRRKRRVVLVSDGANVVIYRQKNHDLTVAPSTISVVGFWSSDLSHWGPYIAGSLGLLGTLLIAVGTTGLVRDGEITARNDDLIILAAGLASWASLASALWTSFARVHVGIPAKGSKWTEEILVSPSQLKNVFPDIVKRSSRRQKHAAR
jgi:hypothetical protein